MAKADGDEGRSRVETGPGEGEDDDSRADTPVLPPCMATATAGGEERGPPPLSFCPPCCTASQQLLFFFAAVLWLNVIAFSLWRSVAHGPSAMTMCV